MRDESMGLMYTYITPLKHGQLVVDVNDLDGDLTVCAEICEP